MKRSLCAVLPSFVALVPAALAAVGGTPPPEATEVQLVSATDAGIGDAFGVSVALSGSRLLVGAHRDDTPAAHTSGSAYVFSRTSGGWVEEAKLVASDAGILDAFGFSLALWADVAVVTAVADDDLGSASGSVYVFRRIGTTWVEEQKLVASDGAAQRLFGASVDLEGDTLLVGSPAGDGALGRAYVFRHDGSAWTEEAILAAADEATGDRFGHDVALSGDTALVGAPFDDDAGPSSGAAYAFVRAGTSWSQQAKLVASDATAIEYFGSSVDVLGDRALVGGTDELIEFDKFGGSAWIFDRAGAVWTQTSELVRPLPAESDGFGEFVALAGDLALVSAPDHDGGLPIDPFCNSGAIHAFELDGASWVHTATIERDTPECLDFFGRLAFQAGTLAVGLVNEEVGGLHAGGALLFDLAGPSTTFCDASDGALAACPCANPGAPDTGCDNPQGTGGVALELVAQDAALTRATLQGTGFPAAGTPTSILVRGADLDLAGPVVFGDGLRCVGVPSVRLAATLASGGVSTHVFGHGAMAGAGTFFYQAWHRSTPAMFCDPAAAWNMSAGRTLTWP